MVSVQIFGVKNSQATRAAERFFKERRAVIQMVDLEAEAAWLPARSRDSSKVLVSTSLLDSEGKAYVNAGLKYLKLSDSELLGKIERDPRLLQLPLVRVSQPFEHRSRRGILEGNDLIPC